MSGISQRLCSAVLMLFLVAGAHAGRAATPALLQEDPLVSLEPSLKYVEPGALCTLQVMVDGAVDSLSCMGVYIALDDTAVVEVTIAREGQLFKTAGHPTFFYWEKVSPDSATAEDCVLGYRTFFLAPGELVKFVFRAKALGTCTVRFTGVRLWDIDRFELAPIPGESARIVVRVPTGSDAPAAPDGAFLNYPNPFNPATVLVLEIPGSCGPAPIPVDATIGIYDVSGALVRSLFSGLLPSGSGKILWNGRDDRGAVVAAGVYIGVARTDRGLFKRKMVVIR